jgi:hypothetical protein
LAKLSIELLQIQQTSLLAALARISTRVLNSAPLPQFNVKTRRHLTPLLYHLRIHTISAGMDWFRPRIGGESSLWVFTSAVVVGAAGVFKLRQGLVDHLFSETYCYQSVRTHSDANPTANCFSVSPSGVFTKVYQAPSFVEWEKKSHDGHVVPGLWDGHGHLLQYGEFLNSVDLFGSDSFEEISVRVDAYLTAHPDAGSKEEWIRGTGWDQMALGRMPTAVRGADR